MSSLPRLWRLANETDSPVVTIKQVAIPGSDPFEGYWLPVLPPGPPRAPAAIPAEVIVVDLATDIDWPGPGVMEAIAAGGVAAQLGPIASRSSYTSGAPGAYNITLQFKGTWTVALQEVFIAAADRLSATITGDIPNVKVGGSTIDDIVISAELTAMDGPGGTLGQAGPTALRIGSYLPATAAMRFDSADAQAFHNQGLFDAIVTHEMLHAIGFGTIWSHKGLLGEAGFIGPNAVAEYGKLIDAYAVVHNDSTVLSDGTPLQKGAVPVEIEGGIGTAHAHWSEAVFDGELMTGWLDLPKFGSAMVMDPLSALTTASLRDLGYEIPLRPPVDLFYLVG